jgi:diguanylate cyclase (GGDEF)-like protein
MVYDIFDVPPGSAPSRVETLKCYSEDSVKALHTLRSRAIEQRAGFNLDAEITTMQGRRRWIRITATVECRSGFPVRLFGMKQDITEEKIVWDRTRYLAEFDDMTGLANRSQFRSRLSDPGHPGRSAISALLLVDLDGFKQVNDSFGHAVGDECLRQVAARLRHVCRDAELVARIGGDEFAVLLGSHFNFGAVAELAAEIVDAVRRPLDSGRSLGASVGIGRPDGCSPSELFVKADIALYAAKAAGRNTFRVFKPSMMNLQPHFAQCRSA